MARFEGPVRFRYKGDPELARQYIQFGRVILGQVVQERERTGIPELIRNVRMQDGVSISVRAARGEQTIEIFKEEPIIEREEEFDGLGFVTIPSADEAPGGWGQPFFDGEGIPINPPLGTVGGQYPETWLDYDEEEGDPWVPYRHPDYAYLWPNGIAYGSVSWAARRADESFVLSYEGTPNRYKMYGGISAQPQIYFRGNLLCTAPFPSISGACEFEGFLVVAGFDGGLKWAFRPFREGGYSNDNPYDPETNPLGWRDCAGSGAFSPAINFSQATQFISFSASGQEGLICNRYGTPSGYWGITQNRFSLGLIDGVVTVLRNIDGDTSLDTQSSSVRSETISWACSWVAEATGAQSFFRQYGGGMNSVGTSIVSFREFRPDGSVAAFSLPLPAGIEEKSGLWQGTANATFAVYDITDSSTEQVSFPGIATAGVHDIEYRNSESFVKITKRTWNDGLGGGDQEEIIENLFSRHSVFSIIVTGNLSLDIWLIYDYDYDTRTQRFYVLTADGEHLLVDVSSAPYTFFDDYPFAAKFFSNRSGFEPPEGWCSVSSFPSEDIRSGTDTLPYDTAPLDVETYYGDAVVGTNYNLRKPQNDTFRYYFNAHHDGIDNIIVTAWVDAYVQEIDQRFFGSYEFITSGDLDLLTSIQGTNTRYNGTGVI